jgi:hypothetical protein
LPTHPYLALPMASYTVMYTFTYWLTVYVPLQFYTIKIRTQFNFCLRKIKLALGTAVSSCLRSQPVKNFNNFNN